MQFLLRWGSLLAGCGFELDLFDCWTCLYAVVCHWKRRRRRGKGSFWLRLYPWQGVAVSGMSRLGTEEP